MTLPPPSYDRRGLQAGIVNLGMGGFARAHLARYTHDLLERGADANAWGIVGVGLMPADKALHDRLRAQDCLYTLVERDGESERLTTIGSIIGVLHRDDGAEPILSAIDRARIVTLTVTENGYCLNAATKRLDLMHHGIAADLRRPRSPGTAIGMIVEGLQRRREHGATPFTAVSCDNIQGNGDVLRRAVLDFASARDPGLADWIGAVGRFPNTMVDRITPAFANEQVDELAGRFLVRDACPVFCEPFRQWVIEDTFADARPEWERAGAQLVRDVAPYEFMKLRLLNTTHLALAGLGRLMGLQFVDEAMRDTTIAAYLAALMDRETGPTLPSIPGVDLTAYKAQILTRFANPTIKDTLDRINRDAPLNYLLDPLRDRLRAEASIEFLSLALAAWIKRLGGRDERGGVIELHHPLSDRLRAEARQGGADPRPVLSIAQLFGDLGAMEALVAPVSKWLERLYTLGVAGTLDVALVEASR